MGAAKAARLTCVKAIAADSAMIAFEGAPGFGANNRSSAIMTSNGAGRSIIVVEDDPAVCGSLKFSLEIEGFRVLTYPDAETLLQQDTLPSDACCVVDYHLPKMNGLDLISALRKRHAGLPVMLMTTHPTPKMREIATRERIPIVEKPLLGNILLENIRQALESGLTAGADNTKPFEDRT